jgi:hypothetical protein
VLDELVAGGAGAELLEALDVDPELVADAVVEVLADEEFEAAAAADVDVELEWLLDPHAATSSAGATAAQIRFNIGSG